MVCQAIDIIPMLPEEVQSAVARGITMLAISDHDGENLLKSLGAEQILPMYKSKKKRRGYDQIHALHQALNYLRVLTSEQRIEVCKKVIDIAGHVQYYLDVCNRVDQAPQLSHVEKARDTYIEQGPQTAKIQIRILCEDFLENVSSERMREERSERQSEEDAQIEYNSGTIYKRN